VDRERIDDGVELPGDPLGLGAGPHAACAIPWSSLTSEDIDRFLVDHLGDDFLAVVPQAFCYDAERGASAWMHADLEPLALVGDLGMKQLGRTWRDALPAAAVLFIDHRSDPAAIVGWDGSPVRGLVAVAPSLADLR
jgi:hypothetical protein